MHSWKRVIFYEEIFCFTKKGIKKTALFKNSTLWLIKFNYVCLSKLCFIEKQDLTNKENAHPSGNGF